MIGIKVLMDSLAGTDKERLPALNALAEHTTTEENNVQKSTPPPAPLNPDTVEASNSQQMTPVNQQQQEKSVARSPVVESGALALPQDGTVAERAYALVTRANKVLDGGLHRCKEWGEVKDQFFNAGALFAETGMHAEAAEAFNSSAAICRIYGDPLEVVNAIGFAIDSCKICDPVMAQTLLKEQATILRESGRDLRAAKCMRDLAQISEQLGLDEDAIAQFKEAILLFGDKPTTQALSRPCKIRVAHLTAATGKLRDAVPLFEHLAETCIAPVAPTMFYFKAVLCLFADANGERYASSIAKAKARFLDYQDLDPLFQKGVENHLVRDIIGAFDKPSLANMDAAFSRYNDMRKDTKAEDAKATDEWFEQIGAKIRDNLFQYLLPYM